MVVAVSRKLVKWFETTFEDLTRLSRFDSEVTGLDIPPGESPQEKAGHFLYLAGK